MTPGERLEADRVDALIRRRRREWLARRAELRAARRACDLCDGPVTPYRGCPGCRGVVRWRVPECRAVFRFRPGYHSEDDPGFEDVVRAYEGG